MRPSINRRCNCMVAFLAFVIIHTGNFFVTAFPFVRISLSTRIRRSRDVQNDYVSSKLLQQCNFNQHVISANERMLHMSSSSGIESLISSPHNSTTSTIIQTNLQSSPTTTKRKTLIIIDAENVRGHTSFAKSHGELLSLLPYYIQQQHEDENISIAWIVDHGPHTSYFTNGLLDDNISVYFAGPRDRRDDEKRNKLILADDVITELVKLSCEENERMEKIIVITADSNLIVRSQRERRKSGVDSDLLGFMDPVSFLGRMEEIASLPEYKTFTAEQHDILGANEIMDGGGIVFDQKKDVDIAKDCDVAKDGDCSINDNELQSDTMKNSKQDKHSNTINDDCDDTNSIKTVRNKTENSQKHLLSTPRRKRQRKNKQGKRKKIRHKRYANTIAASTTTIIQQQGEIEQPNNTINNSQTQQKETIQELASRYDDTTLSTTTASSLSMSPNERMKLAHQLRIMQANELYWCLYHSCNRHHSDGIDSDEDYVDKEKKEEILKEMFDWLLSSSSSGGTKKKREAGVKKKFPAPKQQSLIDTAATATVNVNGRNDDPLSKVLFIPKRPRKGEKQDADHDIDSSPTRNDALRIIVISDTHGYESSFSTLSHPSDDNISNQNDIFRLPPADILIHCGDFASSGNTLNQQNEAKALDEFLSHQDHIQYKIVIRGNHDPSYLPFTLNLPQQPLYDSSSSKLPITTCLFPKSKALYITSTTNLNLEGKINMVCEPFTRRHHHHYRATSKSSLPAIKPLPSNCDVMISHEPPRGICDMTYTGVCAGSVVLRRRVEMLKNQKNESTDDDNNPPRLWLCGHIHEGRGLSQVNFVDPDGVDDDNKEEDVPSLSSPKTTLVVNAANANLGKAHRLVAGAVVINLECDSIATNSTVKHANSNDKYHCINDILSTICQHQKTQQQIKKKSPKHHRVTKKPRNKSRKKNNKKKKNGDVVDDLDAMITRPGVRRRRGWNALRKRA